MPYLPSLLEQLGVNSPSEQRLRRRARQASLIEAGAIRAPSTEGLWGKGLHSKRALALARARLRPETPDPVAGPEIPKDLANALAFQEQVEGEPVPGFNLVKGLLDTPLNDIGPKIEFPTFFDLPKALGIEDDNPIANANDAASEAIFGDAASDPEGGSLGEALAFGAGGGAVGAGIKTGVRLGANALGRRGGRAAGEAIPRAAMAGGAPRAPGVLGRAGSAIGRTAPLQKAAGTKLGRPIAGAAGKTASTWRNTRGLRRAGAAAALTAPLSVGLARSGYKSIDQGSPTAGPLLDELSLHKGGGSVMAGAEWAGDKVGNALPGVLGRAAEDAIDLPAVTIPAVYMAAAAGLKAAPEGIPGGQGDDSDISQMWDELKEHSFISNLVQGDLSGAAESFSEHPLYAGLEVAGVGSVASRAGGIAARQLPKAGPTAGIANHPIVTRQAPAIHHPGYADPVSRTYKPGLASATWQYGKDLRNARRVAPTREGGFYPGGTEALARNPAKAMAEHGIPATPKQTTQWLKNMTDHEVGNYIQKLRESGEDIRAQMHETVKATKGDAATFGVNRYNRPVPAMFNDIATGRLKVETFADDLAKLKEDALATATSHSPDITKPLRKDAFANYDMYSMIEKGVAQEPAMVDRAFANVESLRGKFEEVEAARIKGDWITPEQAEMAKYITAARHRMENVEFGVPRTLKDREPMYAGIEGEPAGAATLLRDGKPLTIDEIKAAPEMQGINPIYITQRPGHAGRGGNAFRRGDVQPNIARQQRTGDSAARGTADMSFETVIESLMAGNTQALAGKFASDFNRSFAVRPTAGGLSGTPGRMRSASQAQQAALDPTRHGFEGYQPGELVVRGLAPERGTPLRNKKIRDEHDSGFDLAAPDVPAESIFEPLKSGGVERQGPTLTALQALTPDGIVKQGGKGDYALMPEVAAQRVGQHFRPAGPLRRGIQQASGVVKRAILPTSPKWLSANLADTTLRGATIGTLPAPQAGGAIARRLGLGDVGARMFGGRHEAMMRVRKNVKARELLPEGNPQRVPIGTLDRVDRAIGGGMMGSTRTNIPRRSLARDQMGGRAVGGGAMDSTVSRLSALAETAPVQQARHWYAKYAGKVFEANQKFIEDPPRYSAAAKHLRDEARVFTGENWRPSALLTNKAIKEMADGVITPQRQLQVARSVEQTLGKWHGLSPAGREMLIDYAPFGAWAANSFKFVFANLPKNHPIKTGLVTAAAEMTEDERKKLGLSQFADEDRRLPASLRASIPNEDGTLTSLGRMTSLGQWADPTEAPGFILPFIQDEFGGQDFLGRDLVDDKGAPLSAGQSILSGLIGTAETATPFWPAIKRTFGVGAPGDPRQTPEAKGLSVWDPRPNTIEAGSVDYLRGDKQDIRVPTSGASSAAKGRDGGFFGGGGGGFFDDDDDEGFFGASGGGIFD